MSFDGTEGGEISLETGANYTANYRRKNPDDLKAHFIGKDILKQLLDQEGCMGIRIYYGEDSSGDKKLVYVGADADENDILDLIADLTLGCPNLCGNSNDLNS